MTTPNEPSSFDALAVWREAKIAYAPKLAELDEKYPQAAAIADGLAATVIASAVAPLLAELAAVKAERDAVVSIVQDMDVPKGAWDFIENAAKGLDGPHLRVETPQDAEVIILWHNEKPAAFVVNLRDQFNYSIQYRAALKGTPHAE